MVRDMTQGKPLKLILSFCMPLMIGNLFQQFYNMVDSIVVGQFVSKNAFAAVGSTGSLNFLIIGFVLGICSGFSIPISQYFGAGDHTSMRRCLANSIYLSSAITVILTVGVMLSTRKLLTIMHTPANIIDDAYTYIIIIFAGIFATMFYNMLAGVLRAIGDSKTPLYFLMISSILNIVLDLLFVLAFSWGVMGVAVATVISQFVSGILCILYIKRNFYILHLRAEDMKFDLKICRQLLRSGLPMGFQFSITAIGSVMLQSSVNSLGSDIVAAVTAAGKVQLMLIQPGETIGITMATFCGQNLGARKLDRINKGVHQSLALAMAYSVIALLLGYFCGSYISLLFIKKSEIVVLGYIARFLKFNCFLYPFLGILFIYRNSLQGLGYSMLAMSAGIFELVARGAFVFFVVPKFGFSAVCLANPSAWIAADILLVPAFYFVFRMLKKRFANSQKIPEDAIDLDVTEN